MTKFVYKPKHAKLTKAEKRQERYFADLSKSLADAQAFLDLTNTPEYQEQMKKYDEERRAWRKEHGYIK